MRKTLIILVIEVILATAVAWAYQNYFRRLRNPRWNVRSTR
mgnify:CR=1 FL=1